ncbi:DUF3160 domain-containing protein [uncultured Aquimarina sp.]|uniref:DUF3160 domain-containing protein n=1 Tax=uncultured Aquimarina sp. TaxID=575652 RepID=UPI00261FBDFA|nr:DUF3160 domain-containing protein [uncultured Aquimarina sp.]
MKKIIIFSLSLTLLGCGDKKEPKIVEKPTDTIKIVQEEKTIEVDPNAINPFVNGILDVEQLNQNIDMSMDISQLKLSDIRILRNSYAAKKGYCFMKADLRGVFGTTSWYDDRMEEKYWNDDEEGTNIVPISYTPEEIKFIDKLKKREEELKKKNFLSTTDHKGPNLDNIVNLFQLESADKQLMSMLGNNGFAIVPNTNIQLFHVYEQNDYQQFPNFVTTDMYMQLFHMYFGYILRTVEEDKFIPLLSEICKSMMKGMNDISTTGTEMSALEIAKFNETYYAIAYSILTSEKVTVPAGYEKYYEDELSAIENAEDVNSEFLEYRQVAFPYSLFKPRGHYTRTESLKRYFKAMMWLQTAPFCLDNDAQLKRAILSAAVLKKDEETLKKYNAIMEPINFIIGQPDNVSFLDLVKILESQDFLLENLLSKEDSLEDFRGIVKKIADIQNKIKAKEAGSCVDKINFIPQRYLSDNEVLQELVDLKSEVSKRAYPKGLDVMAAFGSKSAENLLLGELKEGENWEKYPELLSEMKDNMSDINWNATLYNKWIESLLNLQKSREEYPYFMQTSQWDKKDLNASLASWAELKHDAILYAEQPMAAECGDGGPPSPYTVGYVEPNIGYWKSVIELINLTESVLERNKLINSDISRITNSLKENAMFLLSASEKELAGKKLSDNEYGQIELIGSTFEWLTLDLVKEKDQYLDDWKNVQGPDKSVAVVADIYTANGGNNPDKGILHVATGNVNDIYVLVEIEGYLYLTKGAVFGYHEFHLPMGNRLTDEEWQEMIDKNQAPPLLDWMKEIIVPIDVPKSNEKIFYSSGC